jgi:hypothetical protein
MSLSKFLQIAGLLGGAGFTMKSQDSVQGVDQGRDLPEKRGQPLRHSINDGDGDEKSVEIWWARQVADERDLVPEKNSLGLTVEQKQPAITKELEQIDCRQECQKTRPQEEKVEEEKTPLSEDSGSSSQDCYSDSQSSDENSEWQDSHEEASWQEGEEGREECDGKTKKKSDLQGDVRSPIYKVLGLPGGRDEHPLHDTVRTAVDSALLEKTTRACWEGIRKMGKLKQQLVEQTGERAWSPSKIINRIIRKTLVPAADPHQQVRDDDAAAKANVAKLLSKKLQVSRTFSATDGFHGNQLGTVVHGVLEVFVLALKKMDLLKLNQIMCKPVLTNKSSSCGSQPANAPAAEVAKAVVEGFKESGVLVETVMKKYAKVFKKVENAVALQAAIHHGIDLFQNQKLVERILLANGGKKTAVDGASSEPETTVVETESVQTGKFTLHSAKSNSNTKPKIVPVVGRLDLVHENQKELSVIDYKHMSELTKEILQLEVFRSQVGRVRESYQLHDVRKILTCAVQLNFYKEMIVQARQGAAGEKPLPDIKLFIWDLFREADSSDLGKEGDGETLIVDMPLEVAGAMKEFVTLKIWKQNGQPGVYRVGAIDVRLVLEDMLMKKPDLLEPTVTSKKGEEKHQCYDCYKKFSHSWQRAQHIEESHGGKRVWRCMEALDGEHGERCNRTFPRKETLENHKKAGHRKEKPFTCEHCSQSFSQKGNLETHIKSFHLKEKPFRCEHCNESFARKNVLKNHIDAVHRKEKPFTCEHCNESFARKCTLQRHIRAVHLKEKPFTCGGCGESFSTKQSLEEHVQAVHLKEKPFRCEHCNESFSSKCNLETHIKTVHLKEKPFRCEHCKKSFSQKGNLERHIQTVHLKEKPFACNHCKKSFSQRCNLQQHIQNVHPEKKGSST